MSDGYQKLKMALRPTPYLWLSLPVARRQALVHWLRTCPEGVGSHAYAAMADALESLEVGK